VGNPGFVTARDVYYPGKGIPRLYSSNDRLIMESTFVRGDGEIKVPRACLYRGLSNHVSNAVFIPMDLSHWGHFLTEGSSRIWAFGETRSLVIGRRGISTNVLRVMKISPMTRKHLSKIQAPTGRTTIKKAHIALPSFENRRSCHPIHAAFFESVAKELGPYRKRKAPLYLSRSKLPLRLRKVHGEDQIEEFMCSIGAKISHPQLETVEQQIAAVNEHDVIIGCHGSALHNVLFRVANRPLRVVMFCASGLTPNSVNNYVMINKIKGIDAVYANALGTIQGGRKTGSAADNIARMSEIRKAIHAAL